MSDPTIRGRHRASLAAALNSALTMTTLHVDLPLGAGHDVTGGSALVGAALELAGGHCALWDVHRRCVGRRRRRDDSGLRAFRTLLSTLTALVTVAMGLVLTLLRLVAAPAAAVVGGRVGESCGGEDQTDRSGGCQEEIALHVDNS